MRSNARGVLPVKARGPPLKVPVAVGEFVAGLVAPVAGVSATPPTVAPPTVGAGAVGVPVPAVPVATGAVAGGVVAGGVVAGGVVVSVGCRCRRR